SRFQLKDYPGVIHLLNAPATLVSLWADRYLYWLAEARLQLDLLESAAETYARLLQQFPQSDLRLEASYGEAFARFKMGNTARAIELLQQPSSAFQQALKTGTNETIIIQANFLLAEALLARRDLPGAERILTNFSPTRLNPESESQRQYLLARI